uniref:Uncharacterized protein n=1 Tax=Glossina austeni TaxID=7395 RepID=A0A1A9V5I3_GLOAU
MQDNDLGIGALAGELRLNLIGRAEEVSADDASVSEVDERADIGEIGSSSVAVIDAILLLMSSSHNSIEEERAREERIMCLRMNVLLYFHKLLGIYASLILIAELLEAFKPLRIKALTAPKSTEIIGSHMQD